MIFEGLPNNAPSTAHGARSAAATELRRSRCCDGIATATELRLGQDGLINAGITLPATININTIPDGYSEIYFIRPISIAALHLKLRDDLLSLMERREFY